MCSLRLFYGDDDDDDHDRVTQVAFQVMPSDSWLDSFRQLLHDGMRLDSNSLV